MLSKKVVEDQRAKARASAFAQALRLIDEEIGYAKRERAPMARDTDRIRALNAVWRASSTEAWTEIRAAIVAARGV